MTMSNSFKRSYLYFFFFSISLAIGLSSCGTNYATVGIPAQQEFVLGEQNDRNYRVELKNLSEETVKVKAIDKESGEQTQGFGLAAKGKTTLYVDKTEKVILGNPTDEEVKVKAKLSKGVEGMRYQPLKDSNK